MYMYCNDSKTVAALCSPPAAAAPPQHAYGRPPAAGVPEPLVTGLLFARVAAV